MNQKLVTFDNLAIGWGKLFDFLIFIIVEAENDRRESREMLLGLLISI